VRVRLETLGCRLNIGETEALARKLVRGGHRVVGPGDPADLCILNTCTVTGTASRKSRHIIRRLRRANPGAALVVTGCYAELEPETVRSTGADLVVGNADKDDLLAILERHRLLTAGEPVPDPAAAPFPHAPGRRTRAFVKVQDGCDNRCTFCIVTVARGPGRSRPQAEVLREIRALAAAGYREVVLSGVHLGSYGRDRGDHAGLRRLVEAVLAETPIPRLRLSSLEPWDLDPGFFALFREPRLLPHLHLPLQSGCDATLRRMARRTTVSEFADLVAAARAAHPDMAVTTDVIVGFPGETDEEFEESFSHIASLGFARLHVFRFSARRGTAAAVMPGRVPAAVAAERSRRMHELGADLERRFVGRFLGRVMDVLWEDAEPHGPLRRWSGLTGNYIRVVTDLPAGADLANRVTPAALGEPLPGAVLARVDLPPEETACATHGGSLSQGRSRRGPDATP